jgi:CDP-paratose 2-epimerase
MIAGCELDWSLGEDNRIGDHRWWISDLEPFKRDYPDWDISYGVEDILCQIHDGNTDRWIARA